MGNNTSISTQLRQIMKFEQSFHEDLLIMYPDKDDVTLLKLRVKYTGVDEERIRHAIKNLGEGHQSGGVMRYISHHESEILFLNDEFMDMISEYKYEIRSQVEGYANVLRDAIKLKLKTYGFRLISFHIVECVTRLPSVVVALNTLTVTKCLRYAESAPGTSALMKRESKIPSYICLNAVELFVDALSEHPVYRVRDMAESSRRSLDVDIVRELYKTSKEVFTQPITVGVIHSGVIADGSRGNAEGQDNASGAPRDITCIQRVNCDSMHAEPFCIFDMMQSMYQKVQDGQFMLQDSAGKSFPSKLEHLAPMFRKLSSEGEGSRVPRRRARAHSLSMRVTPRAHVHYR